MNCWAVLPAAGSGTRLAAAGGLAKQFLLWQDEPLYWHAAKTFAQVARVRGIVVIFPACCFDEARDGLQRRMTATPLGVEWRCVPGGESRQASVRLGLDAVPDPYATVLIHDAVRPFVSPALPNKVLDSLSSGVDGVVPVLPLTDTVKEVDAAGRALATPDRSALRCAQTPQAFRLHTIKLCHSLAQQESWIATDDASLLERYGYMVATVEGEETNLKITTPKDLNLLCRRNSASPAMIPCTGFGYDVHRYGGGRPFILGGVPIATELTLAAHSDGDVLLHALMDALLGCLGEGDIGRHFPDTDSSLEGCSSGLLLAEVLRIAEQKGIQICHADCTVVAQAPKISAYREHIQKNIASLLRLPKNSVGIKATTEEGLGFTGEKHGIKAYAVVACMKPAFTENNL